METIRVIIETNRKLNAAEELHIKEAVAEAIHDLNEVNLDAARIEAKVKIES